MKYIDNFLNNITMYRLVLYGLIFLAVLAVIFGFTGILSYSGWEILLSVWFLIGVCWLINLLFAGFLKIPSNSESSHITALILALIASPISLINIIAGLSFLFWLALIAIASKYLISFWNKHFFNPVAFSAVLLAYFAGQPISWWVGNTWMALPIFLVGFLVVRKIRRWDLVLVFLAVAILTAMAFALSRGTALTEVVKSNLFYSPLLFFAFFMLTEPLTTPPTRNLRIGYAVIAGLLISPQVRIGSWYFTPELALLIANIFSYLVSPKRKLILKLEKIEQAGKDVYDFLFSSKQKMNFQPGQYLEWTLGHRQTDNRGNRRYFTIASSPTENLWRLGVRFNEPSSSYKKRLKSLQPGDTIIAGQLAGDFVLPKNPHRKLVFIAGGIGVTPFRSMIKYLTDRREKRDIVMFYSNKTEEDIAYQEIFSQAEKIIGLRVHYILTKENAPNDRMAKLGLLDEQIIKTEVPDYAQRLFYLSGPNTMVNAYKNLLINMGIKHSRIITDYFPGFA